ncbi:MAG TPA: hypothetical protein PKW33_15535 [Anaerolineaceae bacterium]|nr:hypothetical protein [Anaerolineaceae bacterium]HPN53007.1 hypothetical protein [Anaerolineaceae bacterium]
MDNKTPAEIYEIYAGNIKENMDKNTDQIKLYPVVVSFHEMKCLISVFGNLCVYDVLAQCKFIPEQNHIEFSEFTEYFTDDVLHDLNSAPYQNMFYLVFNSDNNSIFWSPYISANDFPGKDGVFMISRNTSDLNRRKNEIIEYSKESQ